MSNRPEIFYIGLIFALFIFPRVLERFYVPSGISAFAIGFLSLFLSEYFQVKGDPTISVLAILGISSLFLFAGLEVDLRAIYKEKRFIIFHLFTHFFILIVATLSVQYILQLSDRASILYALALTTPSAGFILDSLDSLPITDQQKFWIKTKAIAAELLALAIMFFTLQSQSWSQLAFSTIGVLGIIVLLPPLFFGFTRFIAPFAKNSEFAFFIMLAILAALITKELGAYFLVGAFIVGVSIQRFRYLFTGIHIDSHIQALKLFSTFFIPFYFFKAGTLITLNDLSVESIAVGILMAAVVTSIRVGSAILIRRLSFGESLRQSFPVSMALVPNLIFGLVLWEILCSEFGLNSLASGALLAYTACITVVPGILMKNTTFLDIRKPLQSTSSP